MTSAIGTTDLASSGRVGMPRGSQARKLSSVKPGDPANPQPVPPALAGGVPGRIEDGFHGADIGSLQALALAVTASILLTGLLWVVL
ncbi:hypothetical protein [Methylobacterium marchantiae]|uniref:hypothetical protein n=1 Tax=Methylobacterium marchantiae TaxID=600331 RepID=UPI002080E2F5|nr:hypothetical protein AIGOOFII_3446 [Methylobacterium marchantiae]